jgi:hypothetical protein
MISPYAKKENKPSMIPLPNPLLCRFFVFSLKKSHSSECFASDGWKHRFQQVEAMLPMGGSIVSKVWKFPLQWADVEISADEITMHSGIQKKKSVICFDIPLN